MKSPHNSRRGKGEKWVKGWRELEGNETLVQRPFAFDAIGPLKCIRKVDGKRVEFEVPLEKLLEFVWLVGPSVPKTTAKRKGV